MQDPPRTAREDRALSRPLADIDAMPDPPVIAVGEPLSGEPDPAWQPTEQGLHPDAAPSSRDGDAFRFGLALIVLFIMFCLLVLVAGGAA